MLLHDVVIWWWCGHELLRAHMVGVRVSGHVEAASRTIHFESWWWDRCVVWLGSHGSAQLPAQRGTENCCVLWVPVLFEGAMHMGCWVLGDIAESVWDDVCFHALVEWWLPAEASWVCTLWGGCFESMGCNTPQRCNLLIFSLV
jgi:hypothetical protein